MHRLQDRLLELFRDQGEVDSTLADDIPTGEQYDQLRGGRGRTGPHLLMLAVLEDGIRSYLSPNHLVRTEAESWVQSNSRKWPFAFASICDALGFEVEAARKGLERLRAGLEGKRLRRIRGNVRHVQRVTVRRLARVS
jgi:hypothetical protein